MTKVTVKSPDLLLGKIEQALAEIGQKSCTVEIYNEVPYTEYVEYGTSKMAPRGMVRRSMPAVEDFMTQEFNNLPFPPTKEQIEGLMEDVQDKFLQEVIDRTPIGKVNTETHKPGTLKRGWQKGDLKWT